MVLKGTQTEANLQAAFAQASQAQLRYLYFAQTADIDGHPDVASLFRQVADSETGHAVGLLEYLAALDSGDPLTGEEMGSTEANLRASVASETYESTQMYPDFAAAARGEGFVEIAEWFESLGRAETSHASRFRAGLDGLV